RLERVLQDIVKSVRINSDFTLTHPEHQSLELSTELSKHFAQMPSNEQHDYLRVKLQQFLQYIYYVSEPRKEPENSQKIKNRAIKWLQSEFVWQLDERNHGDGYFESGWQIIGETESGLLQVCQDELTLHIHRQDHLLEDERAAQVGETVRVKMPCQLVEPGYFIAVGTAGSINSLVLQPDNPIVDIYLNITSQGALALMDKVTTQLNAIAIPFHFQVLYQPEDYIYADTATISFAKNDYSHLQKIIEALYRDCKDYFQAETPLFTKYLAPGLSIAERPAIDVSLAQHRCQIIADALVTAWQQNKISTAKKFECIKNCFRQENIDFQYPYLNPDSKDIYTVIS
ncbi:MAG: T3SS effector HopA1 family protein, partial [Waterburya sp.]